MSRLIPSLGGLAGAAVAIALGIVALPAPALAGQGTPDSHSATVSSSAEAWYTTLPASSCSLPVGCPPAPAPTAASAYTPGTLHVGVLAGAESARAYVKLDLSRLPLDAALTAGTLALPVSADQQAGNIAVDTAALRACLVTSPVTDGVEGGTGEVPKIDCGQAEAKVVGAATNAMFTVDLTHFLKAWSSGVPNQGVALVPDESQAQDAHWQVSFIGKKATASPRTSARVSYVIEHTNGVLPTAGLPRVAPGIGEVQLPAPVLGGDLTPVVNLEPAPEPVNGPAVTVASAGSAALGTVWLAGTPWFAYRGVVYLPLLFLAGAVVMVKALARPVDTAPVTRAQPWRRHD
jgi:hypothetical protein